MADNPFIEISPQDGLDADTPAPYYSRPPSPHPSHITSEHSSYSNEPSATRKEVEHEPISHVYLLTVGSSQLRFAIRVLPHDQNDLCTLSLSMKAGCVERQICEPVMLKLGVDIRKLEFSVFLFPPKKSLPAGCLYALRVWIRANGVEHRLFSDDDLWIGDDPDFNSIADASLARLFQVNPYYQIYNARVGKAELNFIARWTAVGASAHNDYTLSLEYAAGGIGRTLFKGLDLHVECDPREVLFIFYTVPITSTPPGASHRLRVWLRCPVTAKAPSGSQTYIFQRIWKTDELKVGSELDFSLLGRGVIMGVRCEDIASETEYGT